jgi:hypothetical protein
MASDDFSVTDGNPTIAEPEFQTAQPPPRFTGREWVFDAIEAWLSSPDATRYFLLTGSPGSGKSAVAARLQHWPLDAADPKRWSRLGPRMLSATYYCLSRDLQSRNPHVFARSLALQLARRYPTSFAPALVETATRGKVQINVTQQIQEVSGSATGVNIERLDVRSLAAEDAFRLVVREPLEKMFRQGFAEPVIVLVDALDEATGYEGRVDIPTLLRNVQTLPPQVRFLLTLRPEPDLLRPFRLAGTECQLSGGATGAEAPLPGLDDVHRYVLRELAEDPRLAARLDPSLGAEGLADAVRDKSRGNFLYVVNLLAMLASQKEPIRPADLDRLPDGLDKLYMEFLSRLLGDDQERWTQEFAPVLGVLAVAQEDLSERSLAALVGSTPAEVRIRLNRLRQFLVTDERLPASERPYGLYHRSFGEFLLDGDRSDWRWCESTTQHQRIVTRYLPAGVDPAGVDWRAVDDYGLRFLAFHLTQTGRPADVLDPVITPAFLRAKIDRHGSAAVLDDLRRAATMAYGESDLARLVRWAWTVVGTRSHIQESVAPQLIPLLVRFGQVDRALSMINTLDRGDMAYESAVEAAAEALTEAGAIDQAVVLVNRLETEATRLAALHSLVVRVARRDRQQAIDLVSRYGLGEDRAELCAILAADDAFVDQALKLAGSDGPALHAIAIAVGSRDLDRALTIAAGISGYEERCAGLKHWRTNATTYASLAIELSPRDLGQAVTLLRQVSDPTEQARALIVVAGALAMTDPHQALNLVESLLPGSDVLLGLALAAVAAKATKINEQSAALDRWWSVTLCPAGTHHWDVDVIARLDIGELRGSPAAHTIALQALQHIVDLISGGWTRFEFVGQGVGQLAAAISVLDPSQGPTALERALADHPEQEARSRETATGHVIRAIAPFDPDAAFQLAQGDHWLLLELADATAAIDLDRAIAFVDQVKSSSTATRAAMLGIIGRHLAVDDTLRAQQLFERASKPGQSGAFRYRFVEGVANVAAELAKVDPDRAAALVARYADYIRNYPELGAHYYAQLACLEGERDWRAGVALAMAIDDGLAAARAVCTIVNRAEANPQDAVRALVQVAEKVPRFDIRADGALADLVKAVAERDAEAALKFAIDLHSLPVMTAVVGPVWLALRDTTGRDPLEDVALQLLTFTDPSRPLQSWVRRRAFVSLAEAMTETERQRLLDWMAFRDSWMHARLQAWSMAATDPDGALATWRRLGDDQIAWREVAKRAVAVDIDAGLRVFTGFETTIGELEAAEVFADLVGVIARSDRQRAAHLIEQRPWAFVYHASLSWAAMVEAIGEQDWWAALKLTDRIADTMVRGQTLVHLAQLLVHTDATTGVVQAQKALLHAAEELQLQSSTVRASSQRVRTGGRKHVYEGLIEALVEDPRPAHPDVVIEALYNLTKGSHEVSETNIARLMLVACRAQPGMAERVAAELDVIERLVAA